MEFHSPHMKVRYIYIYFIFLLINIIFLVHRGIGLDYGSIHSRLLLFWLSYDGAVLPNAPRPDEEQLSPLGATMVLPSPWREWVQLSLWPSRYVYHLLFI